MPSTPLPKYEFELWVNGTPIADITGLPQNRRFVLTRNASEQLYFSLDLTAFENYCAGLGVDPAATLKPYVTDIIVKRNGEYYFGTQVQDAPFTLTNAGIAIEIKATGFLDLFKDRYVTKNYDGIDRVAIAQDLLAETQSGLASNDFGVELGSSQYLTGITDTERNYTDQNVRDGIINLTNLSDGNFDFRFNYDKTFETFAQIGSDRPNIKFTYPYNIDKGSISRTATNLWNYIIAIGSGFGEEALRTETADGPSRDTYKTRQKIVTFNSISVQQTLDQNAYGYLQKVKEILQLPTFNISGELADLSVIGVGDRVPVSVQGHPMLPLDSTYRIEQLDVNLDQNDAEDIAITFDDFGL